MKSLEISLNQLKLLFFIFIFPLAQDDVSISMMAKAKIFSVYSFCAQFSESVSCNNDDKTAKDTENKGTRRNNCDSIVVNLRAE